MVDKNRQIIYAVGAGVAIIGAALIYYFVTKTDTDEVSIPTLEIDSEVIAKQIKLAGLDNILRSANGGMENNYFLKLLQFVGAETRD